MKAGEEHGESFVLNKTSSVSGNWTDKSLYPRGVCAAGPGMNSVKQVLPLGQKLTGDMWREVMHSARYVLVPPSVCVVDWPSSTSGQHCPAFQCLRNEVGSSKDDYFGASLPHCSHPSIPPFSSFPPCSWISLLISIKPGLNRCSNDEICNINRQCSPFFLFASLSVLLKGFYSHLVTTYHFVWCRTEEQRKTSCFSLQGPRTTRPLLERGLANWPSFYTWFKDEETLYLIFLFFFKWEINVEQLLYSLI